MGWVSGWGAVGMVGVGVPRRIALDVGVDVCGGVEAADEFDALASSLRYSQGRRMTSREKGGLRGVHVVGVEVDVDVVWFILDAISSGCAILNRRGEGLYCSRYPVAAAALEVAK